MLNFFPKPHKSIRGLFRGFSEFTSKQISQAFFFIAALAWNEAIKALLNAIFPNTGTLISLFIYALLISWLAYLVSRGLGKSQ